MKNILVTFLIFLLVSSCRPDSTEIYDKHRDNTVSVKDKIIDIKPRVLFGYALLDITDSILIIHDMDAKVGKSIHLFSKNTFRYLSSTGTMGRGPSEIVSSGRIGINHKDRILWVQDLGNKVMWKFPVDSILKNPDFKPTHKIDLSYDLFLERFELLNDSIAIGKAVQIINAQWTMAMSKLNFKTNETEKFGYEHPAATGRKSNSMFALSTAYKCYVNCYTECDLLTICDLDGKLKYNIYGPGGMENEGLRNSYFNGIQIVDKYIFAAYIGDIGLIDHHGTQVGNSPSKFLIYNLDGKYLKTIEVGYKFSSFSIDKENSRIILYFFDRPTELGYFKFNLNSPDFISN
jgi:hypothetical protein